MSRLSDTVHADCTSHMEHHSVSCHGILWHKHAREEGVAHFFDPILRHTTAYTSCRNHFCNPLNSMTKCQPYSRMAGTVTVRYKVLAVGSIMHSFIFESSGIITRRQNSLDCPELIDVFVNFNHPRRSQTVYCPNIPDILRCLQSRGRA
jgi:hypothetical protein